MSFERGLLLKSKSIRPKVLLMYAKRDFTDSGSLTSQTMPTDAPPASLATASMALLSRHAAMTVQPFLANVMAMMRPRPRPAPVITAI